MIFTAQANKPVGLSTVFLSIPATILPAMPDAHRWTPNPDFTLENFGNEILLYSVIGARAIYLNDTAFLVYRACEAGQSAGEIIAQLEAAYPEQREAIRDEVIAALNQLVESGALILHA